MSDLAKLIAEFAASPASRPSDDLSQQYNTQLNPKQEAGFQEWQRANPRLGSVFDYDARGFWSSGDSTAVNGHGADEWKKPNHPTFSDQSRYSSPQDPGGAWSEDGRVFWASPANFRFRGIGDLLRYMTEAEPQASTILPFPYNLPRGR